MAQFAWVLLLLLSGASLASADPEPRPEDVLVYSDDMQNGQFDAMSTSGSGTYSVMDDGGGNLAARLTGDTRLEMRTIAWSAFTWESYELHLRVKRAGSGAVAFGFRWIASLPHAPLDSDRGYWLENTGSQWSLVREIQGGATTLETATYGVPTNEWYQLDITVDKTVGGARVQALINGALVLSHTDATPIAFGGLAFRTAGGGTELWLDDVRVIEHVDSRYTWSQTRGPEGGDFLTAIAVDPVDWRVAYLGGGDAGIFKTTNGGTTWVDIGIANGLYTPRIKTIELAPSNHDVIYAGAGGKQVASLWRSDDAGASWKWTAMADLDTKAETDGVAVDAGDPFRIFFSFSLPPVGPGPEPGVSYGIYRSTDGGSTVTHLTSLGDPIGPVEIDPGDPFQEHILAGSLDAATSGVSIISSADGGVSWLASDAGIPGKDIQQILFYPPDPTLVFAVARDPEQGGTVYRSVDGGTVWAALTSLPTADFLQYSPHATPMLIAHGQSGSYASTNGGGSWEAIADPSCEGGPFGVGTNNPTAIYASRPPDVLVSTDLGQTCTNSITDLLALPVAGLAVAPSDPDVVYAGTVRSLHKSIDGGATWEFLRSGQFAGIAVDPTDSDTVYIGAVEFAQVLKSEDGGQTWTDITGVITYPGVHSLTIDPQNPQIVYAGTGHGPQMGGGGEGLYRSTNGGDPWEKVAEIPDVAVPAVVVHPEGAVVVVGTSGNGVYVSEDGGASFAPRNKGFLTASTGPIASTGPMVWALAVHPGDRNVIYAGTNAFYGVTNTTSNASSSSGHVHSTFVPETGVAPDALYKTTDGGLNWTLLLAGEEVAGRNYPFLYFGCCVDAIAINPARPDEVYVALHDPGVVFTDNGGQDWRYVNHGLVPALTHLYPYRMAISGGGEMLYTTTCGRSVFRNRIETVDPPIPLPILWPVAAICAVLLFASSVHLLSAKGR